MVEEYVAICFASPGLVPCFSVNHLGYDCEDCTRLASLAAGGWGGRFE